MADKGFPSALGLAAQRAGWRFSQNWLRSWLSRAQAWFPGLCFHYTDAFSKQDLNTALSCLCSRAAFDCFRVFWVIIPCIPILIHYSYIYSNIFDSHLYSYFNLISLKNLNVVEKQNHGHSFIFNGSQSCKRRLWNGLFTTWGFIAQSVCHNESQITLIRDLKTSC